MSMDVSEQAGRTILRRFSRFKVSAPVLIRRGSDRPCLGMTSNAAVGGCRLVVGEAAAWSVGDCLILDFEDDQQVRGIVRWVDQTDVAVEFEEPLLCLVLDDAGRPVAITADRMQR
jgi:hypothetical protein